MKRIALVAAAAAATLICSAAPVFADARSEGGLVVQSEKAVEKTVNPIVASVPTPPGWKNRHVCAWSYQVDQSWCVFFPFPV